MNCRGFTLIEILVAITVASLLLLAVYGAFGPLSRARDQVEKSEVTYHQARVLFDRLGRELRSLPLKNLTGERLLSGGTDERGRPYLELVSSAATPLGGVPGGIARISYRLAEDPDGEKGEQVLFRNEQPRQETLEAGIGSRMISGVKSFQPRFYDGAIWYDSWPSGNLDIPLAVEINLVLSSDGEDVVFRTAYDVRP